jgi:hypothetical protein
MYYSTDLDMLPPAVNGHPRFLRMKALAVALLQQHRCSGCTP